MEAEKRLHLVRGWWSQLAEQPLTTTELRVIMAWYGGRVTADEVIDGRARSASGVCFALLDGGQA